MPRFTDIGDLMKTLCVLLLTISGVALTPAFADAPNPSKVSKTEAAGAIFDRKDAVHEKGPDGSTTDVSMFQSADKKVQAGLYKAGASDQPIESYPEDEFCYLLSGEVKLTSTDGSVLTMKAGDSFAIHKGWKGRWTTPGYTKYYVTYETK
jgi:uncharacterized cupin superfamily protein